MDGVLALSGKPIDFGIVTTPQLHYFVACKNTRHEYGIPTEEGYYHKLVSAFLRLRGDEFNRGRYRNRIMYDGANGVGAKKIKQFQERLGEALRIEMYNDEGIGTGKLNYLVRMLNVSNLHSSWSAIITLGVGGRYRGLVSRLVTCSI